MLRSLLPLLLLSCAGSAPTMVPCVQPLQQDPDRHPFRPKPAHYHSPLVWDGVDQTVFRPLSQLFAVDPAAEAPNVNALDEVADSSWFTNRIGQRPLSPADVASGPCAVPPLDPSRTWLVTGGKFEGATPGFVIAGPDKRRYLVKVDDVIQAPRPTAADAIGSRVYYATGFEAPCNRVVFFDRSILHIAPGATASTPTGGSEPVDPHMLDTILTHATRLPDGRYRASASLWLTGDSLGPFRYEGTRSDDPNDVIRHEDRRELRGERLLAAWLDHVDSREENTLTTWISTGNGYGWVRHAFIDFSDCFGDVWDPPALGRTVGHEHLFDLGYVSENFVTFGVVQWPWQDARFGASGKVFGYFDVARFEPSAWRSYYPIAAFKRMSEHDGAWMARIIAHFTEAHLNSAIAAGRMGNPLLERELLHTLRGRQAKLLIRYMVPLSSLAEPELRVVGGQTELRMRDLSVLAGIQPDLRRRYSATLTTAGHHPRALTVSIAPAQRDEIRVVFPRAGTHVQKPEYLRLELRAQRAREGNVVLDLYARGAGAYALVGLTRHFQRAEHRSDTP